MSDENMNNFTIAALKSMSVEDIERYKTIGKHMYGSLPFDDEETINELNPPIREASSFLCGLLKSGLHPSMMDENEKRVMEEVHGDEWYKKFGYINDDLTNIVTTKFE